MTTFLYALHFIACFVLITVVLLQRGKGSDLGAALGGGGSNTIFGARGAGNFLTRITTGSAVVFMCTSLSLAYFTTEQSDVRLFDETDVMEQPVESTGTAEAGAAGSVVELEEVIPEDSNALEEIPAADDGAAGNAPSDGS